MGSRCWWNRRNACSTHEKNAERNARLPVLAPHDAARTGGVVSNLTLGATCDEDQGRDWRLRLLYFSRPWWDSPGIFWRPANTQHIRSALTTGNRRHNHCTGARNQRVQGLRLRFPGRWRCGRSAAYGSAGNAFPLIRTAPSRSVSLDTAISHGERERPIHNRVAAIRTGQEDHHVPQDREGAITETEDTCGQEKDATYAHRSDAWSVATCARKKSIRRSHASGKGLSSPILSQRHIKEGGRRPENVCSRALPQQGRVLRSQVI